MIHASKTHFKRRPDQVSKSKPSPLHFRRTFIEGVYYCKKVIEENWEIQHLSKTEEAINIAEITVISLSVTVKSQKGLVTIKKGINHSTLMH